MKLLAGWVPDLKLAWTVLAVWVAVVLMYGLWRSRGDGKQDPIRPSGPEVL